MKKGQFNLAMEMPLWFLRIGLLILILVVIVAGVSTVLSRNMDYKNFESQLISYDIYNCLSYNNHIGTIDASKLNNLDKCINFRNLEIRLNFTDFNNKPVIESYVNKEKFSADWPLCNVKLENENLLCYSSRDYVFFNDVPVTLEFSIINLEEQMPSPIENIKVNIGGKS